MPEFQEISRHLMKFAMFGVNFGMPQKSRTKTHEIPAAHPLAGGAVLVAVEGPSPGRGEGKKLCRCNAAQAAAQAAAAPAA